MKMTPSPDAPFSWRAGPRSEWIVVPLPRIIDDNLFARVQGRIRENRRFAARRLKRWRVYLLCGLLECGLCGYACIASTQTSRSKQEGPVEAGALELDDFSARKTSIEERLPGVEHEQVELRRG